MHGISQQAKAVSGNTILIQCNHESTAIPKLT